eukprot:s2812_g3.t1
MQGIDAKAIAVFAFMMIYLGAAVIRFLVPVKQLNISPTNRSFKPLSAPQRLGKSELRDISSADTGDAGDE